MPIPDFQAVMRPLLEAVQDGTPMTLAEVRDVVCTKLIDIDRCNNISLQSGGLTNPSTTMSSNE
jgi:hypothetical protein